MKKLYLFFPVFIISILSLSGQGLEKETLGLISYLTDLKIRSEYRMTTALAGKKSDTGTDINSVLSAYNSVMIDVNRFINQLSADLISRNSLCVYRKIDKFVNKSRNKLTGESAKYTMILQEIDANFKVLLPEKRIETLTASLLEQIVGAARMGVNSVESLRDFREKKVGKIVSALKELELKSVSELNDAIKITKDK
jgi:hypothetical protein